MAEELKRRIQALEEKVLALQDELTQLEYAMEVIYEVLEIRAYRHIKAQRWSGENALKALGH